MTLTCDDCGSVDVKLNRDNGAEYPETRVEWYECLHCNAKFKKVLTA